MHFNRPDVIFFYEHDDNNTMSTVSLCRLNEDFRIDYMVECIHGCHQIFILLQLKWTIKNLFLNTNYFNEKRIFATICINWIKKMFCMNFTIFNPRIFIGNHDADAQPYLRWCIEYHQQMKKITKYLNVNCEEGNSRQICIMWNMS